VRGDPEGAIDYVVDVLRSVQFVAAVIGKPEAYDKIATAMRILQEVKECLGERKPS
jgi:hypothetical protein